MPGVFTRRVAAKAVLDQAEARSPPKSEVRRPKAEGGFEVRRPKPEAERASTFGLRPSGFRLPSALTRECRPIFSEAPSPSVAVH